MGIKEALGIIAGRITGQFVGGVLHGEFCETYRPDVGTMDHAIKTYQENDGKDGLYRLTGSIWVRIEDGHFSFFKHITA